MSDYEPAKEVQPVKPCSDCVNGKCDMNCGPVISETDAAFDSIRAARKIARGISELSWKPAKEVQPAKAARVEGVSDENCDHGLPIRLCSACRIPGNDLMQADEDSWAVQSDFEPADDGSDEDDETQQPTPSQGSGDKYCYKAPAPNLCSRDAGHEGECGPYEDEQPAKSAKDRVLAVYPDAEVYVAVAGNGAFSIGSESIGRTISAQKWSRESAWVDAAACLPVAEPAKEVQEPLQGNTCGMDSPSGEWSCCKKLDHEGPHTWEGLPTAYRPNPAEQPPEPISYGTCSVCRSEQIGVRHEHECE